LKADFPAEVLAKIMWKIAKVESTPIFRKEIGVFDEGDIIVN